MSEYVKLDQWARALLVDPLSKTPLREADGCLVSDYGRRYPLLAGALYDLRLLGQTGASAHFEAWRKGQDGYEAQTIHSRKHDAAQDYELEGSGVAEVYEQMPIIAACLDVGGEKGRLRAFLDSDQKYLVVDPYLDAFDGVALQTNMINTYPFLLQPVNFVCAFGEHLPIRGASFDTVHMRSVIDHMYNPELALWEANRVLKVGGQLIVGSFVRGGASGRVRYSRIARSSVKRILHSLGAARFAPHTWHPTYDELCRLIAACGFKLDITHWQERHNNYVCYIRALKHL